MKENVFRISSVIRVGKIRHDGLSNKHRPLLVKMRTARDKWSILKGASNLKFCTIENLKNVSVVPDLSIKERELDRKLRDELKENKENGETGWFIK